MAESLGFEGAVKRVDKLAEVMQPTASPSGPDHILS